MSGGKSVTIIKAMGCGLGALAMGMAMPAHAANSSAASKAKILAPVTVAATGELDFGTFVTDGSGGIIDMDQNGNRTSCMGFSICSGATSAATFQATGTVGQTLVITSPGNFFLVGSNGGTVEIGNVIFSGPDVTVVSYFNSTAVVPASGSLNFNMTGSLWAQPGTDNGEYSGSFTVNVNYQ